MSATIPYNSADVITTITTPHEDATKLSEWAILLGNETIDERAKQRMPPSPKNSRFVFEGQW